MLPKDYLAYRLSGSFCTDVSDASGMLLLDVKNRCWSKEMLEICGITEEQLPKLYEKMCIRDRPWNPFIKRQKMIFRLQKNLSFSLKMKKKYLSVQWIFLKNYG